jgi:hypothetical protein
VIAAADTVKAGVPMDGCITDGQIDAVVKFLQRTDMLKTIVPASAVVNESALPIAEEALYCRAAPKRRTL